MSVLATSTPLTRTREKAFEATEFVETIEAIETAEVGKDDKESKGEYPNLAQVPCIWYPITFRKKSMFMSTLFNSGSEVNAIHPTFAWNLGLSIRPTDVGDQKIDGTMLDTFGIVVSVFSVTNKANRVRFFEETFLVANVSPEVVLGMPFLTLSGADVDFSGRELRWKTYTVEEALPTTRRVKLVGKKEFAAAALDPEHETYVVHVASLHSIPLASLDIHLFQRPQISGLITEEALTNVSTEYLNFADVFSSDLAFELPEYIGINDHAIKLVDGQQPPYGPIYSLKPVELETIRAYIETNLANGFIRPSKSPASSPIFFKRK